MSFNPTYERPRELTASEDPTKTKTIRETYGQRLRGAFGRINTAIRERVTEDDIFGLEDTYLTDDEIDQLLETFAGVDGPPDLSTIDPGERVERFEAWLDEAMDSEVLEVIDRDENVWIRRAYERGVEDADSNLKRAGVSAGAATEAADVVEMPVHERKLHVLFARNYAELDGICDAVAQQVTRELADGLAEGVNPREMARRLTDRVDKIGKTRATVLARTETINAHTQASVERYRQQGVEEVGIEPEVQVQTAGDEAVCEQCAEVASQGPWELDEFEGSEYQPAIHPQCRCAVVPVVNEAAASAYLEHPKQFVAMLRAGAFVADSRERYEALAAADDDGAEELVAHFSPQQTAA
ncbi:minor capsid protein [Natrarchaeobaculum sulfurireducens]|uniref:Phage protein containing C-terminal domain related to phage head morphogenesis Mu gpF-like n=1 Tax=Natrarchaeobaculum sulfurireducens TaxID=2044521 RepID=A0A346PHK0_9EURY|nr:minor capsid protein [Natrarchaeobaculum sulfurireducens]AXR78995.1 Phage protein containing C-terminal domain related to phage head morphogenesis Mu gpF-like [Natrarchaeobaculum sulfurireducens]